MQKEALFPIVTAVLARASRAEILQKYPKKSCCIASSRIVIDVLARYGIASKPMAVRAVITGREDTVVLGSLDGTIGKPPVWNGTLAGHLIAVVPTHGMLIDSALDQAPTEKFDVGNLPCPLVAAAHAQFIAGRESAYFFLQGCGLLYEPHPIPPAVLATPKWNDRQPSAGVADKICAQIDRMQPVSANKFKRRYAGSYSFCEETKRHTVVF